VLFDSGTELLIYLFFFSFYHEVVHSEAEAGFVRREHGHKELGGQIGDTVSAYTLEQGGELLILHTLFREKRRDGELGAFTRSVEERRTVVGKDFVALSREALFMISRGH
jgi:hypothetical protein